MALDVRGRGWIPALIALSKLNSGKRDPARTCVCMRLTSYMRHELTFVVRPLVPSLAMSFRWCSESAASMSQVPVVRCTFAQVGATARIVYRIAARLALGWQSRRSAIARRCRAASAWPFSCYVSHALSVPLLPALARSLSVRYSCTHAHATCVMRCVQPSAATCPAACAVAQTKRTHRTK